MDKVLFAFIPSVKEPYIRFECEILREACFYEVIKHCELEEYLDEMEIIVCTTEKGFMFRICGFMKDYYVHEDYKHLEPIVKEICEQFFVNNVEDSQ